MKLFGLVIEKASTHDARNRHHEKDRERLHDDVMHAQEIALARTRALNDEMGAHEETRDKARHLSRALGRLMEICREIRTAKWAADAAPATIDELVKADPIYLEVGNRYALVRAGIAAMASSDSWRTPPIFDKGNNLVLHIWLWAPGSHWIERAPATLAEWALEYLPDQVKPSARPLELSGRE